MSPESHEGERIIRRRVAIVAVTKKAIPNKRTAVSRVPTNKPETAAGQKNSLGASLKDNH